MGALVKKEKTTCSSILKLKLCTREEKHIGGRSTTKQELDVNKRYRGWDQRSM